ncbi:class I SAM-dependent methyltransferase [Massilia glaciei]|uniref:class I SAM-dependent methyltransferase n=1 Tax=Massilia glaciei TaxID=1524097 RepID=UPI0015E82828|nr:class I SAM-dependent methyltransferase [Massilia glaciei]
MTTPAAGGADTHHGDLPGGGQAHSFHGIFAKLSRLALGEAPGGRDDAAFADFWQHYMGHYLADIPVYERLLPRGPSRVLDLSCGAGRIGIALARVGAKVDVLVGSDVWLALARANVAKEAAPVRERLQLHRGQTDAFSLGLQYDLIVLGGTSLNLTRDEAQRLAMLRRIGAHLLPDGKFIFDIMDLSAGLSSKHKNWHDVWHCGGGDGRDFAIVGQQFMPEQKRVVFNFYRESIAAGGDTVRSMGSRSRAWLEPEELLGTMHEGGLHLLNEFGQGEVRYFVAALATPA